MLSIKIETHELVRHLTRDDIVAIVKFAVITAIVLPVLPDRSFGPESFKLFNPFKVWLFVIFISSVSLVGYVLVKFAGARKGIGLTGLFGGIASSTAVTISFTDRSKESPGVSKPLALAILLAWSIMFIRVVGVVAPFNGELARLILVPMSVSAVTGLLYCLWLYRREALSHNENVTFSNPFKLGPAIKFGAIFTAILCVAKAAQSYFGSTGVYVSSAFAGLADVDAIAFSMAKLSQGEGAIPLPVAARAVVMAAASNTLLKGSIIFIFGAKTLKRDILPGFVLMTLSSVAVVFLM
jgi:uncharacterized membrane protein (DUF4010 family)